jgi:peptidoglycan/xylan/chitin deacetylase (PgdA/CDA1 family)
MNSSPTPPQTNRTLIVTHDVDWPFNGPGKPHVLARQDRFATEIIKKVDDEGFNPYYGVPRVMEIEEKFGIRSTFFFRPKYDDGSPVGEYAKTMQNLISGGWEVGLHCNKTATLEEVREEKGLVEKAAGKQVFGTRVHYLNVGEATFANLLGAGIKYDSSLSFSKDKIDSRNTGYIDKEGLVVFPVTFMDAYLFTYMGLTEETIVPFMAKTIQNLFDSGVNVMTLLWHDNSVMMRGGRAYADLIKQLTALPKITFLKGIEAYEMIQKQKSSKP